MKQKTLKPSKNFARTAIVAAIIIVSLLVFGCVDLGNGNDAQNGGAQQDGRQIRGGNGGEPHGNFVNMTPEQMQAIQQERAQAALAACEGKTQGEACLTQSARGDGSMRNGTCEALNATNGAVGGTLSCFAARPSRPPA